MGDSVDYKRNNLNALRADVDETTNVLKVTVEKLVDRGDRLDALTAKADDLNQSSVHFYSSSKRVSRTMKWKNYKITFCIGKFHLNQFKNSNLFVYS
jgi:vesicle-associated membrane protein 4